jgi:hypothetical protein
MSDTPRTDEELYQVQNSDSFIGFISMTKHSKNLERELAAMTAERDEMLAIGQRYEKRRIEAQQECAELRQLLRIYCSENIEDKLRESLKLSPRSQP